MKKLFSLLLLAIPTFAGQSIEYGAQNIYNLFIPNTPVNRVELRILNWTSTSFTHLIAGTGIYSTYYGASGWRAYLAFQIGAGEGIVVNNMFDNGPGVFIPLGGLATTDVSLRFQHDTVNPIDYFEAFDNLGNNFFTAAPAYTSLVSGSTTGTGLVMGNGGEPTVDVAFMRMYTSLVPLNSRPPVNYDPDPTQLFAWPFDCTGGLSGCPTGGLADSTGNGYTASYGSGTPTFVDTPIVAPVAILKAGATTWANTTTCRAGFPCVLDGTASYTQLDGTNSVTYSWVQLSGPSSVFFDNTSSGTPSVTGLVFGDYVFQLTVCDTTPTCVVTSADVGAVAQDSKGIIVNANPIVDALFGPMIAWGQNPWGEEDAMQKHVLDLRSNDYLTSGWDAHIWEQTGAGTVSYTWNGIGLNGGNNSCANTVTTNITATTTSIPISEASCLDLSSFPTRIWLNSTEEVRISGTTATSGVATLTVAFDGRGSGGTTASSWSSSTLVGQYKVTGTGTNFLTDPTAPVCPLGASTPPGAVTYNTGTANLTAASTSVTGVGTAWVGSMVGYWFVATATHSTVPFVFTTSITAVGAGTAITLARAFPSTADTGSYSYSIISNTPRIDLRAALTVDTTGIGEWYWLVTGCESSTSLFININVSGHNFGGNNGLLQSSMLYSVDPAPVSWISNGALGGEFFYGENMAWRNLYFSSGLNEAKNAADIIDGYLVQWPGGNPEGNGFAPLITGGPVIGSFFAASLGSAGMPPWSNLRSYAAVGEFYINDTAASGCNKYDPRNTGYAYEWISYSAAYDPDTSTGGWRSRWKTDLTQMAANDLACKTANNSFTSSYLFNNTGSGCGGGCLGPNGGFGPVTLTNNSAVVTAVTGSISTAACIGTAQGFATVVNGSPIVTVTSGSIPSSSVDALTFAGTSGGSPFASQFLFSGSGSSATLSVNWPWDSGTVSWMSTFTNDGNGGDMVVFGTSENDTVDLNNGFNCMNNGDGTITLDHAWPGTTGSSYVGNISNIVGTGIQPFYLGVRSLGTGFLSRLTDPTLGTIAAFYKTLSSGIAQWLHDVGTDLVSLTTNYGIGYQLCSPANPPASSTPFDWKSPGCNYSSTKMNSVTVGREQNSEIMNAISEYYLNNPTSLAKTWGDQVTGAVFGTAAYNTGGVPWDFASVATNPSPANWGDSSWQAGKWPGFFFGMGSPRRWPAIRLGGVDPPNIQNAQVAFSLSTFSGAASVRFVVTAPTGLVSVVNCTVSPCIIPIDVRTGSAIYTIVYLDSTGKNVGTGPNTILNPPGASPPTYILLGRKESSKDHAYSLPN